MSEEKKSDFTYPGVNYLSVDGIVRTLKLQVPSPKLWTVHNDSLDNIMKTAYNEKHYHSCLVSRSSTVMRLLAERWTFNLILVRGISPCAGWKVAEKVRIISAPIIDPRSSCADIYSNFPLCILPSSETAYL